MGQKLDKVTACVTPKPLHGTINVGYGDKTWQGWFLLCLPISTGSEYLHTVLCWRSNIQCDWIWRDGLYGVVRARWGHKGTYPKLLELISLWEEAVERKESTLKVSKAAMSKVGKDNLTRNQGAGILILEGLLSLQNSEENFICPLNHLVYGILL